MNARRKTDHRPITISPETPPTDAPRGTSAMKFAILWFVLPMAVLVVLSALHRHV